MIISDPTSFEAFCQEFNNDQICAEALFRIRWPDGFRCPVCQNSSYYFIRTRKLPLFECRSCRRQTSVIAGTIMEGSSTPLTRWFQAIFLLSQPNGISSVRLSMILQVTYKTAWLMSHKIRHAIMKADESEPLTGVVYMHQTSYGYRFYLDAQHPLMIAGSTDEEKQITRVKIKQPHPEHVTREPRWVAKSGITEFEKNHLSSKATPILSLPGKRHPTLNSLHWEFNRWLNNTFMGIGPKHLQAYLDEFCYRLNAKLQGDSSLSRLLFLCASTKTLIYKELTREKPVLKGPWKTWESKGKWKGMHLSRWSRAC